MNRVIEIIETNQVLVIVILILFVVLYKINLISKELKKVILELNSIISQLGKVYKPLKQSDNDTNEIFEKPIIMKELPNAIKQNTITYRYDSKRLSFRKATIDMMKENDLLIISVIGAENPENNGVFKMTKNEIYNTFRNVIDSVAYKRDGNYNYQNTPNKAQAYRIP